MFVFGCSSTAQMQLSSGARNEMLYPVTLCLMLIFCPFHRLAAGSGLQVFRRELYCVLRVSSSVGLCEEERKL